MNNIMAEKNISNLKELSIYEGGNYMPINIPDLLDNEIALRQLINDHNKILKEAHESRKVVSILQAEIEYQKTSPFNSIIATITNILGSIIVAFSVNYLSKDNPPKFSTIFLIIGFLFVIIGSVSTIFFPYMRKYFNRKKNDNEAN